MATRTVVLGAIKYRRADGVWLLALQGETVDVHRADVARFDAINVSPTVLAPAESEPDDVEEIDEAPAGAEPSAEEHVDLSKLKVAELKEFAELAGIDLGNAKLKDEILAVIEAAEAAETEAANPADADAAPAAPEADAEAQAAADVAGDDQATPAETN